jgi:hypothetical protein
MAEELVRNVIRDTRRKIKYVIWAKQELNRRQMLDEVKKFNYTTTNIRQKPGTVCEIFAEDD